MIIEIRRAGFINKGAELMLHAILNKLRDRYPDAVLVVSPTSKKGSQPFAEFTRLGMFPKASLWRNGIQWGDLACFLPKKLREMYGLILDREIDFVIDAAGFSYSDQWGVETSKELAASSKRWKKQGTKVILMPQAFGPFRNKDIQHYVKEWVKNVDLVYAREIDSYNHLVGIVGENEKIRIAPDFTNLIAGVVPENHDVANLKVALVPNCRMIDKTGKQEGQAYLPFMVSCAEYLVEKNAKPFILVHEGEADAALAEQISQAVGGIPIVKEADPLKIKGILGVCDATIGSRFHGLVSALSQGVPSLAAGWSHKYVRLLEDYGFPDGVISVLEDGNTLKAKIDMLLGVSDAGLRERLLKSSEELKAKSMYVWDSVFAEIDQKSSARNDNK